MALFFNSITNKVDRKGRVSVPATFRAAVEGTGYPGIIIFDHFDRPCLEGSHQQYFSAISDMMTDPFSDAHDDLATAVLGACVPLPFDPEGRVTLPASLRSHAGITDQATFVGMGRKFRIWAPEAFEAHKLEAREHAAKVGPGFRGGAGAPS